MGGPWQGEPPVTLGDLRGDLQVEVTRCSVPLASVTAYDENAYSDERMSSFWENAFHIPFGVDMDGAVVWPSLADFEAATTMGDEAEIPGPVTPRRGPAPTTPLGAFPGFGRGLSGPEAVAAEPPPAGRGGGARRPRMGPPSLQTQLLESVASLTATMQQQGAQQARILERLEGTTRGPTIYPELSRQLPWSPPAAPALRAPQGPLGQLLGEDPTVARLPRGLLRQSAESGPSIPRGLLAPGLAAPPIRGQPPMVPLMGPSQGGSSDQAMFNLLQAQTVLLERFQPRGPQDAMTSILGGPDGDGGDAGVRLPGAKGAAAREVFRTLVRQKPLEVAKTIHRNAAGQMEWNPPC